MQHKLRGCFLRFFVGMVLWRTKEIIAAYVLIATFGNVGNFGLQLIEYRLGEISSVPATVYFMAILFIIFRDLCRGGRLGSKRRVAVDIFCF